MYANANRASKYPKQKWVELQGNPEKPRAPAGENFIPVGVRASGDTDDSLSGIVLCDCGGWQVRDLHGTLETQGRVDSAA